jgi:structural maintenance of chromosome 1
LFKLYHNEQEVSNLTSELRGKSRESEKLESKKQSVEQQLKSKRQENAKLSREMATIEKTIREKVKPLINGELCTLHAIFSFMYQA